MIGSRGHLRQKARQVGVAEMEPGYVIETVILSPD